ncbi:MAG: DNA mismatch repair protein MutS, partial [Syntrophobacterales bacterium]|nr:DNA mismatch repair protein MutS [Syntrophobacterales bacterium]
MTSESLPVTPAMQQYMDIKKEYADAVLLFRMGDFYEMFFEDAKTISQVLDLTLTSRNKSKEDSIPLCGFPYHAAPGYITKLINKGFKVAICEQLEDPKSAKGLVKRDVIRVVTPGLVMDDSNLNPKEHNFLAAVFAEENYGTAFVDLSTGEFWISIANDLEEFLSGLMALKFREVILPEKSPLKDAILQRTGDLFSCRISDFPEAYFDPEEARELLIRQFSEEHLAELDLLHRDKEGVLRASGAVLRYIRDTQKNDAGHLTKIDWYQNNNALIMDEAGRRNLEIFTTIAEGRAKGSLFHVIDETVTSMGGRKLRWWLTYPLVQSLRIQERLLSVAALKNDHLLRKNTRKDLARIYDLERLGSRIVMNIANARDLIALKNSLEAIPEIKQKIAPVDAYLIRNIHDGLDEMRDLYELIERAIVAEPPISVREGGMIKKGYDEKLDHYLSLSQNAKQWIAALEAKEKQRTGINSLKVGFNNIFGYYIEISKANYALVPGDYVRKQTLVNAERYINDELKKYEYEVLNAEDGRREREYQLFAEIRERIASSIARLQKTAARLAELDALASLAEVAEKYHYCCPVIHDGHQIHITDGRHPVIERMSLPEGFVPNDISLDLKDSRLLVITGPNMAGKSTYIRQIALIVLLAQMGSFVPAAEAHIGVVDKIFARIGAADNLSRGQSTFMIEMAEVAHILKNITPRSLVILDEVGRGTSTFDGLSIAWAVAEHLHDFHDTGVRTLFATHYHQLTELTVTRKGVRNYTIAVKEKDNQVIFLRKIIPGGTNRSYGIHVAKIAGVHDTVIQRANEILENIEAGELDITGKPRFARKKETKEDRRRSQMSLFADEKDILLQELQT